MKDTINCILFKSISFSDPWVSDTTDRSSRNRRYTFCIETIEVTSCLWILMHFKHLEIEKTEMYYRKQSKNKKKLNPQRKLRNSFTNTTEILTYLSDKNYDLNYWEIRFKNEWEITHWHKTFTVKTYTKKGRDEIMNKLISIVGINPIDTNTLDQDETFLIKTDGTLIIEEFPF